MFPLLAKANKLILPSLTKRRVDLAKASRWQILLIGYRYYVTSRALEASNSKSPKN
ncbi:MAG TPA: SsrA-binding protein [Flavobacteriaceae bacterium]|nr:SsrA-binding protein [Flavobacteriaceae bacterium]